MAEANIHIVCQTGPEIGLGHLSRSLALAAALRDRGAEPRLTALGPPARRGTLERYEHRFLESGREGMEELKERIAGGEDDVLAVDLSPAHPPPRLAPFLEQVRQRGITVVGVDGPMAHAELLDLLFVPSFLLEPGRELPGDLSVRYGWECIMAETALEPRPWEPGPRVLVLTGGSDAAGLGETLPDLLDRILPEESELHWVRGPYAPAPEWPPRPRLRYEIHDAPSGLDELMREAHYALTVYGVSFFELLKYGVPTVVFSPYGEKDKRHLELVEPAGAALTAPSANEAAGRLGELMENESKARHLSERARELLAVDGAERLAGEILNLIRHS